MTLPLRFIAATPVLASLDIERSVEFFSSKLGFSKVHVAQGAYGIVANGPVQIHFWACAERRIAEATGCRVQVQGVEGLHALCVGHGIVHPNARFRASPGERRSLRFLTRTEI